MDQKNKFGIIVSVIITVAAVGLAFSSFTTTPNSIQNQGQQFIEQTRDDILEAPDKIEEITSESINKVEQVPKNLPETFDESVERIKEITPELPPIIEKSLNEDMLAAQVSIQPGAYLQECEEALNCLNPYSVTIYRDGSVTWTNNDAVDHNIISGTPDKGPNGIFDSGLIAPGSSFSQTFTIEGNYDYFCVLHPWVEGNVFVEKAT